MFFKKYKPIDYWTKRGRKYKDDFVHNEFFKIQENTLVDYLKTIQFESVLEYGCGFGRITKLLLDNFEFKRYKAFDLSEDQIKNAKKTCSNYDVKFELSTIQDYDDNQKYDLVIGVEILMHILPTEIKNVLEKLSHFTENHMVNLDYYGDSPTTKLAKHNFLHEYGLIYEGLSNVKNIHKIKINEKQSIFHAIKQM